MTGMPHHNPLSAIAHDSIGMAKDTGDKKFQLFAMVAMAVSGLVAILHSVHMIYRDLKPKRENDKPERSYQSPPQALYVDEPPHLQEGGTQRSWVQKARVSEQPAESEKRWTKHCGQPAQSRHH